LLDKEASFATPSGFGASPLGLLPEAGEEFPFIILPMLLKGEVELSLQIIYLWKQSKDDALS
jgi:hypothetical protein